MHKNIFLKPVFSGLALAVSLGMQPNQAMEQNFSYDEMPVEKTTQILGYLHEQADKDNCSLVCWTWCSIVDYGTTAITLKSGKEISLGKSEPFQDADLRDLSVRFPNCLKLDLGCNGSGITEGALTPFGKIKALTLGWAGTIENSGEIVGLQNSGIQLLTTLTELNLRYNHNITCVGVIQLLNLTTLSLGQNDLFTDAISLLTNLTILNLGDFSRNVSDVGMASLTNLKELTIEGLSPNITNNSISLLTNLEKLNLNNTRNVRNVNEDGITHLVKLRELKLDGTFKIVNSFAGFDTLTSLKMLHLANRDYIDKPDYFRLKASIPSLQIEWKFCNNNNRTWL